jgi:hypothetical protein
MPPRNIRRTMNLLILVAHPVGCFFFAFLGVLIHWTLAFLAFPWLGLIGLLATGIRCPKCQVPVGWHTYRFLAFRYEYWSPFTPRRCERCGYDLTGREKGGKEAG